MKQLTIENFGPIKSVEITISDFNVFIGPQASGKSTIAKAIYFFMSLKDDLIRYVYNGVENNEELYDPTTNFKKKIRQKFVGFWGTTKQMPFFKLSFQINSQKTISLYLKEDYVNIDFTTPIYNDLTKIFNASNKFLKDKNKKQTFISSTELFAKESEKRAFYKQIEDMINVLFVDDSTSVYIPAGRSLLSTLSDPLQRLILGKSADPDNISELDPYLDYPLKAFIERISSLKTIYNKSFNDIIKDKKKYTSTDIKLDLVSLHEAKAIISNILKGEYKYDKDGEKLYLKGKNEYVKLSFASSGQQESIWILMQLFTLVLNNTNALIIIEEPEAHLYPVAQKEIVNLIALVANLNNNKIIITTHSPYILTSINNLVYASQIGKSKPKEVSEIIPKSQWINYDNLNAFYVDNGDIRSIKDDDIGLIKAEEIDNASTLINREFETLTDLNYEL